MRNVIWIAFVIGIVGCCSQPLAPCASANATCTFAPNITALAVSDCHVDVGALHCYRSDIEELRCLPTALVADCKGVPCVFVADCSLCEGTCVP